MPDLVLTRHATHLHLQLDEHHASVDWNAFAALADDASQMTNDPIGYGRALYALVFADAGLRAAVERLTSSARLLLVSSDAQIGAAGWEYLRDDAGDLLAARVSLVRGLPAGERPAQAAFQMLVAPARLAIVAAVTAPVGELQPLDTEGEWKRLVEVVTKAGKALKLTRVRPPTLTQLGRTLDPNACSVVHFMGHGNSVDGRSVLFFENELGSGKIVSAADFAGQLDPGVALVVLNSCLSSLAGAEWTEFGNLARGLVGRGIPYALGMRAKVLDSAALEITGSLYAHLLHGRSIEEAVRRLRADLAHNAHLPNCAWLAGLPLLYTSQPPDAPALSLAPLLKEGAPTIDPDPAHLAEACDLSALPAAAHLVGRADDISRGLHALTGPQRDPLVVIHGLGGVGKTALARALAERASWCFADYVLALSFETFASMQGGVRTVDPQFASRFFVRLAHFYGLDPADAGRYPTAEALQEAILQRRTRRASLLVLDNLETLLDVLAQPDPAMHRQAAPLAAFLARLHEGEGAVLITTRIDLPPAWGKSRLIHLGGLDEKAGAALFWELLPPARRTAALLDQRMALSRRVQGHPVSLRLLAGRFGEGVASLAAFLAGIEETLRTAEQRTPPSLADPQRQATLYACLAYSVDRLTPEQRATLQRVSIFRTPFTAELGVQTAADVESDAEHPGDPAERAGLPARLTAENAARLLQELVRLGLVETSERSTDDASLTFCDLHAMVRWYVAEMIGAPAAEVYARYAAALAEVAASAYEDFNRHAWLRLLVGSMIADLDAALPHLPRPAASLMAYHLAQPYQQLGFMRRALELYEEALEMRHKMVDDEGSSRIQSSMADVLSQMGKPQEAMALYQESLATIQALGDVREIAVTQSSMADVLRQMGKPQEALALYQESLATIQALGDVREIAVTQSSMADVLRQMGKPQEALALYQESLATIQALGDVREIAVTQSSMADVLRQMGKPQEALALYQESLATKKALGDVRSIAVTQSKMADVLSQMGKPQEAMALYQESLATIQALGDVREIAVTQSSMADVLRQMGKPQEALALYQESLATIQALGDVREIAVTQSSMADVLRQMGKPQEALALYQESLATIQALGDVRAIAVTQSSMADVLSQLGKPQEALALYQESLATKKALGDVRSIAVTQSKMADVLRQLGKPQEALALYQESLATIQALGDVRSIAVTQSKMADVLRQMGKPQEAMALYQESLATIQALGDVREIAVTQSKVADVLRQMGKPQEALALYQESLQISKELGEVQGVAVVSANMGQLLLQIGNHQEGLSMLWAAYMTLDGAGYVANAATMRQLLAQVKLQVLGAERFDALWPALGVGSQPAWLADATPAPPGPFRLPPDQQRMLAANTVAVLTTAPEKRAEWRAVIAAAGQQMAGDDLADLAAFNAAILALLDEQPADLPADNDYHALWQAILDGVAQGGLPPGEEDAEDADDPDGAPRVAAINAFVGANSWAASRQVVEEQQEVLLSAAVEQIFLANIARARASGDNRAAAYLQQHLDLLLACRRIGIGAAFAALEAQAAAQEVDEDDDGSEDGFELPFDLDLIPQTIAALRGSHPQRLAHLQTVLPLAAQADDPALKAFWSAVQMALVGADLREVGRKLTGLYAQLWAAIVAGVSGGGQPDLLEMIVGNTLAVLGPAAAQRGQWRSELEQLHSQAAAEGMRGLADLAEALLALLAGGNPAGLGRGLEGPFAQAWQQVVARLRR
jgi:tetratricopeptide (TPR) repeat protein